MQVAGVTPLEVVSVVVVVEVVVAEVVVVDVVEPLLEPQVIEEAVFLGAREVAPTDGQPEGFLLLGGHAYGFAGGVAALLVAHGLAHSELGLRIGVCKGISMVIIYYMDIRYREG